ncbi:MAG TPA: hypothetical protein VHU82_15835 [Vicinamibacterales bacterium]|jgi:hypothetical protein|nr:hypothetical protein [Vicinamibacterales bacterium]
MDPKRELLRHAVATVAYRGGKAVRGAPESFAGFGAEPSPRPPVKILAHIGDLFDWALTQARGTEAWVDSTPLPWHQEIARFFETLRRFDGYLASDAPTAVPPERLLQGAIADALTHVGQLAMLRRLAGIPIRGENYSRAEIVAGRVTDDQAAPRREFD